ncbi:mitochondrial carrier domain-containing protein [Halteromyces radiatus]|uniref:mitochondrial carrier domain-containing protein n=1 Tax=Halteromyces radiatus TaxID=101107 RepID=UPI002220EAFE|nr:mitochondrial carrier domain-containing protein [Halteromyces radiatus]KAI8092641.1 mitochondrial carrier domain-containing protein [Halteromyces radiatus]
MVGKLIEYPFDTIKVRLQTQPLDRPYYSGPTACFFSMLKNEGATSFYKGMASPLVGAIVENAALFVGYRQIQKMIRHYTMIDKENNSLMEFEVVPLSQSQLVLAGALSGTLASIVLTPVELIKCKLQVQLGNGNYNRRYTGPLDIIRHTIHQHGMTGFYRGFLATCIRETGGGACWFGFYEYTCDRFIQLRRQASGNQQITKADLSPYELMLGGAFGGVAYNISFFPVDVVKSHMQVDEEQLRIGKTSRSFMQTTRELYNAGGIKAFYRGCGITAARSAPTSAIIFMTYELLSGHFS